LIESLKIQDFVIITAIIKVRQRSYCVQDYD